MAKLDENSIEQMVMQRLADHGFQILEGHETGPEDGKRLRTSFQHVVFEETLRDAVARLNPSIPETAREDAVKQVLHLPSSDLAANNETFHTMLCEGAPVEYALEGEIRGHRVKLMDFENPGNNTFMAVHQLVVVADHRQKRFDLVIFINGLPLVVGELKSPVKDDGYLLKAYNQIAAYKQTIPALFQYNGLVFLTNGFKAVAGSLTADFSRFLAWRPDNSGGERKANELELDGMLDHLLTQETLLDIIRHFTVFEKSKKEDPDTGLTQITTQKKIAAYHQYYAVNKALRKARDAAAKNGDRRGGVVWHTQGSGKSLSMVFYAGKLVLELGNPTIVVITDRNDLDDQLFDTFTGCRQLLRQDPAQAETRQELRDFLNVAAGGIVFTTIQKFSLLEGEDRFPMLSDRRNIIVIADEAHRSQYGFTAGERDVLDRNGELVGKRTVYGFAKYLRDALPNATFTGFTGTPVEESDRNTKQIFGDYVDIYDIAQAQQDGATVKIFFESRLAKVFMDDEGRALVEDLDRELENEDQDASERAKVKWTRLEAIAGSKERLDTVARDIVDHFETRQEVFTGKGMIVAMSRRIAVLLYQRIIALKPEWHSGDLDKGAIKVVMTTSSQDGEAMEKHHTTKSQRRVLADRFKDPNDPLQMVIVRDMWLTGFDVPCLHTMYVDKPMEKHNLMQAIARVNRVFGDKPGGLVVDYIGIATQLKQALAFYSGSGGRGKPAAYQEEAVNLLLEKLEQTRELLRGFDYRPYFTASNAAKLRLILQTQDFILSSDDTKTLFISTVNALSQALALAIPHPEAMEVKEEVSFFQAVRGRLQTFSRSSGGLSPHQIETVVRQVVDQALQSGEVIDMFEAAGIKKPSISILSEPFLEEVKGMKHKNLAAELLKSLLKKEIGVRSKKNRVMGKRFLEMLENAIRRYQGDQYTSVDMVNRLIEIAREFRDESNRGEALGMSEDELAFYDALAENQSARDLMGRDTLRKLAALLVIRIKENASIDWNIKESVRSRMRVAVKRLLREYGYPPDFQQTATDTVLQQAELFTQDWLQQAG